MLLLPLHCSDGSTTGENYEYAFEDFLNGSVKMTEFYCKIARGIER
jgi:hypothetical protein